MNTTKTHTRLLTYGTVKSQYWYFSHEKYAGLHSLRNRSRAGVFMKNRFPENEPRHKS